VTGNVWSSMEKASGYIRVNTMVFQTNKELYFLQKFLYKIFVRVICCHSVIFK